MNRIELRNRTEFHVKEYYQRVQDAEIRRMIPLKAQSLEEALNDYYSKASTPTRVSPERATKSVMSSTE